MTTRDKNTSDGPQDDSASAQSGASSPPPVDLQKRRLAREMEDQIGGLFGIETRDIEAAIDRLWESFERGDYQTRYEAARARVPETIQRAIHFLEGVHALALQAREEEDPGSIRAIVDLIENCRDRTARLLEE